MYEIEDLCEELEEMPNREMAIKSLFTFMENNAGEDLGSPGCIVKLLETFPTIYESELYDSINRKPTFYNLWMLTRYLNSLSSKSEKEKGVSLLKNISNDTSQTDYIRERARDFFRQSKSIAIACVPTHTNVTKHNHSARTIQKT